MSIAQQNVQWVGRHLEIKLGFIAWFREVHIYMCISASLPHLVRMLVSYTQNAFCLECLMFIGHFLHLYHGADAGLPYV